MCHILHIACHLSHYPHIQCFLVKIVFILKVLPQPHVFHKTNIDLEQFNCSCYSSLAIYLVVPGMMLCGFCLYIFQFIMIFHHSVYSFCYLFVQISTLNILWFCCWCFTSMRTWPGTTYWKYFSSSYCSLIVVMNVETHSKFIVIWSFEFILKFIFQY